MRLFSYFLLLLVLIPPQVALPAGVASQARTGGQSRTGIVGSENPNSNDGCGITLGATLDRYALRSEFSKKQTGTSGSGKVETSRRGVNWISNIALWTAVGAAAGLLYGDLEGCLALGFGLGIVACLVQTANQTPKEGW